MKDKLSRLWDNPLRVPTLVGVIASGVGGGIGYILGKRATINATVAAQLAELDNLRNEYETELKKLRQDDSSLITGEKKKRVIVINEPPFPFPQPPVIKRGEEFVNKAVVVERIVQPPPEELVTRSVFEHDDWNYDLEEKKRKRNPNGPYVIHEDEFAVNEENLTQVTLTYYAGDDVMADEDSTVIYDYSMVTGPMQFGRGSTDPNIFHVRNMKRKAEYQIVQEPGLYSVEVLGVQIENNTRVKDLKHSRAPGKFRDD